METLFKNARILRRPSSGIVEEGELLVSGTRISYVGRKAPSRPYDRVVDCRGGLLMPGFKDAHAHSAMVFARSASDDLPLDRWLNERIFPLEANLAPGDVLALSKVAILEYLSGGITAAADMYYFPEEIAEAGLRTGFRFLVVGTPKEDGEGMEEFMGLLRKWNSLPDSLVRFVPGFHAEYTATERMLLALSKASHELRMPVWAHNSETAREVEECRRRHRGMSPTEYMDSLGLFDYGGGGYHCVHFSESDMEIFRRRGCHAVSCPGSNSKLASGIAPLSEFHEKGISLALGTDGAGSNNALDMFYEMRLSAVLQKLRLQRADAFDGLLALEAATEGGARAMGLEDSLYLEEGQKADLVLIDLDRPEMRPLNDIARNLVYSGSRDAVRLTMVDGKILYEDGEFHVGERAEDIYRKAEEVTHRLLFESETA